MALMKIAPAHGGRSPESEHRPLVRADPQEYDIPGGIAIGKLQGHRLEVKCLRRFGAPNRQVRFVKIHKLCFTAAESKLPTATPAGGRSQLNHIAGPVSKIDRTG